MRIISGLYKGRNLDGFDIEGTRPTTDRVKKSLFDSIQDYIEDSITLDLFSGSGSLGIEAISNGAKYAYLVDNSKEAIKVIEKNINALKIDNVKVIKDDYNNALNYFKNNNIKFDLVLLDPPYKDNYIDNIIKYLLNNDLLNDKAIIVCEYEFDINNEYDNLKLIKEKKFGYKKIIIFKKI